MTSIRIRAVAGLVLFAALPAFSQTIPPFITSLNPSSAAAGSASLNLTVAGNNFVSGAVVRWNNSSLATTFVSNTQLNAVVPANLLSLPGFAFVVVANPDGSSSSPSSFTISSSPLTISTTSLIAGTVGVAYSATLAATGGAAPYVWSTVDALPPGLFLSQDGTLTGTPTTTGAFTFTIRVSDRNQLTATSSFSMTISAPQLTVTTTSPLPAAVAGTPYSLVLTAIGGTQPYRWSIGGDVPDGLRLAAETGTVSGTPQTRGTYSFTAQVTDNTGATANKVLTLTVNPAPLTITTEAPLFDGTVGSFYSQAFFASGGIPPYRWALISGQPPTGVTFNATTAAMSGTPTAQGTFPFNIQVTDSTGKAVTKSFSITVALPRLSITTPSQLADGTVGTDYRQQFAATGGTPPYIWFLIGDGVPGLTLNPSTGILSDTPTTPGTFNFTAQVRDGSGGTASRNFIVRINPRPLAITSEPQLPDGAVTVPYSQTLAATGGIPPYTWSANGLPKGLEIDAARGVISGAPEAAGQLVFTVRVTDSARSSVTSLFRLSISLPSVPALTITGLTATSGPADQKSLRASLSSPYLIPVAGQLVLSFASEVGAGDSTIQFSTGGRTVDFTIPAGTVEAVFPVPNLAIQTGTVAGTISVTAQLQAGGIDVTPASPPQASTHVDRGAPVIRSARLVRSANGFSVQIVGFATSREVTQAVFRFRAASGNLSQSEVTVPVESLFTTWFQDTASSRFGSQFTFTQPFTIQNGDANAITPESVVLTNRVGSATATIN